MSQVSSENSNIMTYFPSFDSSDMLMAAELEFSQSLAKIELIINEEWDFEQIEDIVVKVNDLYNCMIILVYVVEKSPKLKTEFEDYFENRLNVILSKIFLSTSFKLFYHIKPNGIDFVWQVQRLLKLIYTGNAYDKLNKPVVFRVPTSTTIVILKCLQYPLFKYRRTEIDETIDSQFFKDKVIPCEFFRGKEDNNVIVTEKLNLLEESVSLVLLNCTIDKPLLNYFEQTFTDLPVYFSYGLFAKHCSMIIERALEIPLLQNDSTFRKLFKLVNTGLPQLNEGYFIPEPPKQEEQTVVKRSINMQEIIDKRYKNSGFKYRPAKTLEPEELQASQVYVNTTYPIVLDNSQLENSFQLIRIPLPCILPYPLHDTFPSPLPGPLPFHKLFKRKIKLALGLTN